MGRALHALVDGLPADVIAVNDRGLQYGHGMFETCRIVDGCVPLWPYHRARLDQTARRLNIPLLLDPIDAEVAELGATQHTGIIKVLVTAGTGRGFRADGNPAGRIVTVHPPSNSVVDRRIGATVRICRTRLAVQPALAGLKHLNRLERAVISIWPVARVLERSVARLQPGRITFRIMAALEARFGFPGPP